MAQRSAKVRKSRHSGVFLRPDSKFYWITYRTPDGRRYRESTGTTSVLEAVKIRSKRLLGHGIPSASDKDKPKTLKTFAPEYLEVQGHLKSYATLEGRVRNLVESLGHVRMEDMTARDYERYRAGRLKGRKDKRGKVESAPCQPATVNRDLQVLKNMLQKALSYGYVTRAAYDRIAEIKKLREENTIIRYLTRDEEASLLKACVDLGQENERLYEHLHPIVLTALRTGLRKGEILALRREDVNLGKRIIHVVKSKSGKRRDVPIAADLLGVLRAHLGSHCMEQVFWHGDEKAEAYKDVRRSFKRALGKAGITAFRFHDCRHHMASQFVMEGGNILHLQKILGHQSVQMTERYAHLAPDFIEAATRVLDGYVKSNGHVGGHVVGDL